MILAERIELEIKSYNSTVTHWLLFIDDERVAIEAQRSDLLYGTSPHDNSGGSRSGVSDKTGNTGAKLAALDQKELWVTLIDEVERKLPPKMQIFLKLRREYRGYNGRQGWAAPVQFRYAELVAQLEGKRPEDVWISSRATFHKWWSRIVTYTAVIAAKNDLL